jgi:hypothetical protein
MCESGPPLPPIQTFPLVIDEDAVVAVRPFVALPRPAPVAQQVARLIELEYWWRAGAAQFGRLLLDPLFLIGQRRRTAVHDPDVIVGINPDADRLSENPVIRHRLGPQRIDFEARRLHGAVALRVRRSLQNCLRDAECDQECENTRTDDDRAIARELPHLSTLASVRFTNLRIDEGSSVRQSKSDHS